MGDVIRLIPESERERARLIGEARAMYDSIFSPADRVSEQRNKPAPSRAADGANVCCDPGGYNLHSNRVSSGELRGRSIIAPERWIKVQCFLFHP
jgi:hypothetical protein